MTSLCIFCSIGYERTMGVLAHTETCTPSLSKLRQGASYSRCWQQKVFIQLNPVVWCRKIGSSTAKFIWLQMHSLTRHDSSPTIRTFPAVAPRLAAAAVPSLMLCPSTVNVFRIIIVNSPSVNFSSPKCLSIGAGIILPFSGQEYLLDEGQKTLQMSSVSHCKYCIFVGRMRIQNHLDG